MGRGWHDGKRIGARIRGFSVRATAPDRKSSGFPPLPGIEENPSDFEPPWANRIQPGLLHHPPRSRGPRPVFNRTGAPPSTSRGQGSTVFQPRAADHQPIRARTRNRRNHSPASQRADHGGAVDCRTLLVHLRHRITLGRAPHRVAGCAIRSSAGSVVAPGGGNRGNDLAAISGLPSTDRR